MIMIMKIQEVKIVINITVDTEVIVVVIIIKIVKIITEEHKIMKQTAPMTA